MSDAIGNARRRIEAEQAAGRIIFPGSDLDLVAELLEVIEEQAAAVADELAHKRGKVSNSHTDTAKRAAALPRFGSQRWEVLDVVHELRGATAAEVADATGLSRNQAAARMLELREAGLLSRARTESGTYMERSTGPGSTGVVHTVTAAGHHLLEDYARRAG